MKQVGHEKSRPFFVYCLYTSRNVKNLINGVRSHLKCKNKEL